MKYFIGIDPGVNTGLAVWNSSTEYFTKIMTVGFWDAIGELESWSYRKPPHDDCRVTIVIEDPNLQSATFLRPGADGRRHAKISQNVGANKRDAQLIIEWCTRRGFPIIKINPSDRRNTKMKADAFRELTKTTQPTNDHGRDAAMLVFGR